jgi:hypothetical protein
MDTISAGMGEIEIFALSALFNLTERREIFISLLFNIVLLLPGFYCLRSNCWDYQTWTELLFQDCNNLNWREKLKVGLHYGDYRSKLVPFEEQKNIFYI